MAKRRKATAVTPAPDVEYGHLVAGISELLETARRAAARTLNSILTATYWEVGRRIVEFEQGGEVRAEYGEGLLKRLGEDLKTRHGRGFSHQGLYKMRAFYLNWQIFPTVSGKLEARARVPNSPAPPPDEKVQTPPALLETATASQNPTSGLLLTGPVDVQALAAAFPLSWSQYVRLLSVDNVNARCFYETEALRGGWSVRQLNRQIASLFYERTALSRNKTAMLEKGQRPQPTDAVSAQEAIRDPYLLEFLNLKDEYSEDDLEEALIQHLETFLLELGIGFTFVARQKNLRIGDTTYHMDLVLFHRGLRCLVIIDLKRGEFTHADAGQMNLYLNYAREHMVMPGEADPIGLILCSDKDDAVVKYALGGIQAQVFASRYLVALPAEETLRQEILITQRALTLRAAHQGEPS
jgi:predicted nuclease of restriction endonuclease-like (RecB) superfamily